MAPAWYARLISFADASCDAATMGAGGSVAALGPVVHVAGHTLLTCRMA